MEAEKSNDLPCASWGQKKAAGVIWSESEVLRTRGPDGEIPVSGRERWRCLSSSTEAEKRWGGVGRVELLLPPPLVYSVLPWTECVQGASGGLIYVTESTDSNADLIWKYPHREAQK